jgi:hypothetical protein
MILDHYSRRIVGFATFRRAPTSVAVRACLAFLLIGRKNRRLAAENPEKPRKFAIKINNRL